MLDLPIGTIIMFHGVNIPNGWLLCDGKNGTPNLVGRFILGGRPSDSNISNSREVVGDKMNKSVIVDSELTTINIKGDTGSHNLSVDEMPAHNHDLGLIVAESAVTKYYPTLDSSSGNNWQITCGIQSGRTWTSKSFISGNGAGHNHTVNITSGEHKHTIDIIPPYTIMSYIIYTGASI
ncbi:MAG: hypothetical protein ACQEWL_00370 [Pseudomonadota bacterium]|uniref:hypothetical protein n=1 Tax=Providencia TaxID=586 RepID=UPI00300DA45A